ncbi:MAG: class II fumarate hydratase [Candidatus Eisenbacteria bacterium]
MNQDASAGIRFERDSMGEIGIPEWAYWGAQTQRAVENFTVSGLVLPGELICALGLIKHHAAIVNRDLGLLAPATAAAIAQAAEEVASGGWREHFPVDVFQTGSGTSSNMNANEVIANRANELLGAERGTRSPVHPNDHVNRGQSSNDVFPSAMHIAARRRAAALVESLAELESALAKKSEEFATIVKLGRTHLQDAVPMTLGQEFSGFAAQVGQSRRHLEASFGGIEALALGGTAIGTGINAHPRFAEQVIARIATATGIPFRPAENRFAALAGREAMVALMGGLNVVAVAMMKIANDLRLLASGPRAGLGEIVLPALQPGSSIMPGKVNPVIPEMAIQVAAQVMGQHVAVTIAGQTGPLELNMMMPLMAYNALQAIDLLDAAAALLAEKCVAGIAADEKRCAALVEQSLALATPLALRVGYDRAALIAERAWREGRTIREIAIEEGLLTAAEAAEVLDARRLARPED